MTLNFNQVRLILADKSKKKSYWTILKEVCQLSLMKKEPAFYYGGKYLYRADRTNYKDYLSIGEYYKLRNSTLLHNSETSSLLRNKLSFALFCEEQGLTVPKLFSHNLKHSFMFQNEHVKIQTDEDVIVFFKKVFERTGISGLFVKEIGALGGKGCYLLRPDNLEEKLTGQKFYERSFIHQELVIQHEAINQIYPHSINTIRFISHVDKNAKSHIISAFMRFGRGGNFIDNAKGGGMYVAINMNSGTLERDAHQSMNAGGGLFTQHPDTGFAFNGFTIPYFTEACDMVLDILSYIPDGFTGWDIGITPNGPVIIEGNENPGMQTADIAYGGLLKHPIMKQIMHDINHN